jgi:glycosyltransferase involved in cell wall biosynthesis
MNQEADLDRCLTALMPQASAAGAEVIVVDNGSAAMPQAVTTWHGVRLAREETPGPGPARNHGVTLASGDVLAFIDADCVPGEGWLAAIGRAIGREAEILGGDVRILHADPARPTVWEAYESEFAYRMEHYIKRQGFTGTGNLAVTRAVWDDVGPFAGIGVAEDRDWGQRATAAGHAIAWVPDMVAYHPARSSFAELARKWDRHTAHDFEMWRARRFGRALWAARSAAMAVSPLAAMPRVLRSGRIGGGMGGRLRALGGLAAIRAWRARRMAGLIFAPSAERLGERWRKSS